MTYEIIDPDTHPGIARKYGIQRYGQTVLLGRNRQVLIQAATEQDIGNAILRLKQDRQKVINVLAGHGEADILDANGRGLSRLLDIMAGHGHTVRRVTFSDSGDVLQDCDVLLIPGPRTPLQDFEKDGLMRLVREGSRIIITLDPAEDGGLKHFLEGFGVGLDATCIFDPSNKLFGGEESVLSVCNYGAIKPLSGLTYPTIFPGAGPLMVHNELPSRVSITSIARTSRTSRARTVQAKASREGPGDAAVNDPSGPFNVGLSIVQVNLNNTRTGIMVFGDTDFLTNAYLDVSGNKDLLAACVNMLLGVEDVMPAGPEGSGSKPFILTPVQAAVIFIFTVIIIPCLVFLPGIILFKRRARP